MGDYLAESPRYTLSSPGRPRTSRKACSLLCPFLPRLSLAVLLYFHFQKGLARALLFLPRPLALLLHPAFLVSYPGQVSPPSRRRFLHFLPSRSRFLHFLPSRCRSLHFLPPRSRSLHFLPPRSRFLHFLPSARLSSSLPCFLHQATLAYLAIHPARPSLLGLCLLALLVLPAPHSQHNCRESGFQSGRR